MASAPCSGRDGAVERGLHATTANVLAAPRRSCEEKLSDSTSRRERAYVEAPQGEREPPSLSPPPVSVCSVSLPLAVTLPRRTLQPRTAPALRLCCSPRRRPGLPARQNHF